MDTGWLLFTILASLVGVGLLFALRAYIYKLAYPAEYIIFPALVLTKVLPIGFLMTGPIIDIINSKGVVSSIPTLASLATLLIFKGISMIWAPVPFFDSLTSDNSGFWCTLPGFEYFENPFLPSSILTSTIIGFYYVFWASKINQQILPVSAVAGTAILGSVMQFQLGGCSPYYKTIFGYGGAETILLSLLVGTIVAGITFGSSTAGGMQNNPLFGFTAAAPVPGPGGKPACPSGTFPDPSTGNCCPVGSYWDLSTQTCKTTSPNPTCPVGQKYFEADSTGPAGCRCPNGSMPDSNGGCPSSVSSNQSGAPQGEQTFVAELYKNGQMITQSIGK